MKFLPYVLVVLIGCFITMSNQAFASTDNPKTTDHTNTSKIALGKMLFNDSELSEPAGQSCASCHQAKWGHSDRQMISPGANPLLFGNRNAPSIHYIKFNPEPSWNSEDETWIGGFFLMAEH